MSKTTNKPFAGTSPPPLGCGTVTIGPDTKAGQENS